MRYIKIFVGLIFLILLGGVILYWTYESSTNDHTTKTAQFDETAFKIIKPKIVNKPDYYSAVGTVKPSIESELEAQISAKIVNILVGPGDKVKKGQLLINLDNRDYQARLERAKQAVEEAKAVMEQNRATFRRIERLVKPGYVSKLQYDRSKSDYLSSIAKLGQAQKSLKEAEVALSFCEIKSPNDGIILDKYVDVGDQAVPGKILLKIQTAELLQLWASVPEELINKVRIAQNLSVKIDSINKTFTGDVAEIVPNIDPKTRTFTVKVSLPKSSELFPGMFGRVLIPVSTQRIIAIPITATHNQGQLIMVNILDKGESMQTIITTGEQHGDLIEVLSGLDGDESIIIANP